MQKYLHTTFSKCKNFYHDRIKSAKIFTMTKLEVQKYLHQSLKTLLKNASSKFLKSLVRIRSNAVL